LLDVGCGNGEFLERARELGWLAVGIDPDGSAVEACRRMGYEAFKGFISDLPPPARQAYDVVTLRHSIEHTADPCRQVRDCAQWLKPGGMLWMAWPNPTGPGSRFFGASWRGLEVPRHLCIPEGREMVRQLRAAGYESVKLHRRGHHARNIMRESSAMAVRRGQLAQGTARIVAPVLALWSNIAATFATRGGDELVVTAYRPAGRTDD
jgi:2-polyprenyl-3-methyl-5-hydroxy-6-metoxy-1,4-benzoquinol methylase